MRGINEAFRREMVAADGVLDTRFRYPEQVSGPADEEICFKD